MKLYIISTDIIKSYFVHQPVQKLKKKTKTYLQGYDTKTANQGFKFVTFNQETEKNLLE